MAVVAEEETRPCLRHFVRLVGPTRELCRGPVFRSIIDAKVTKPVIRLPGVHPLKTMDNARLINENL